MVTNLISFAVLLTFVAAPRQGHPAGAAEDKAVTVTVVDRDSGAPITAFSYQAWYDAPGRKSRPDGDVWTPIESAEGTFEIQTPDSCRLTVMAKAPDYFGPYATNEFVIKSTDSPRRAVVRLRRGITIKGTVRDWQTKEPIAGATVAPVFLLLPAGSMPDADKQVKTGADGRFEVRGVDPSGYVAASHPEYTDESKLIDGKTTGSTIDIFMEHGVRIAVTVVDANGKPLEGVTAGSSSGKHAESGKDGKLVFRNAGSLFGLTLRKDGFIERELELKQIRQGWPNPEGFLVVLEPSIMLTVRVFAPDATPVNAFTVVAGPGKLPSGWDCVRRDVQSRNGRASLGLSKAGTTWVGVAAPGFAAWEGSVEVKRGGEPLEVHLTPGVAVSGKVVVSDVLRNRIKARLVPRRDKSAIGGFSSNPPAERLATRATTLSADGTLRFEHVRPDRYLLIIDGRGIPETVLALDVPGAGLDVGTVRIDAPTETGRIEGRVWHPKSKGGGVWAFADGYVGGFRFRGIGGDESDGIGFQADENGRFKVDGVPAGLTTVGFPYQFFDVIKSYRWSVLVVEGQTTAVGAFDPEGHREFTLAFAIGDRSKAQYESGTGLGAVRKVDNVTVSSSVVSVLEKRGVTRREPMFRVELVPLSKGPLSFAQPDWEELNAQREVVLPDVGPGRYRLRVYDWLGLRGLDSGTLFDREVVVPPEGRGEVTIALGAGCITGKIHKPKDSYDQRVEVTAVPKGSRIPARRTRCDFDGNFCVRYLSPGAYSLFIHDPKAGFCRVDDVEVAARVIDMGDRTLSAGSALSVAIHFARPSRVPDEIVAIGPSGVSVRQEVPVYSSFDRFELAGLWPGRWTIFARSGDEVLATNEVDVKATGSFQVTLTTGGGRGP